MIKLILGVILVLGFTYLVATGIAWIFIWAFDLEYSAWVIGLPVWLIVAIFNIVREIKQ